MAKSAEEFFLAKFESMDHFSPNLDNFSYNLGHRQTLMFWTALTNLNGLKVVCSINFESISISVYLAHHHFRLLTFIPTVLNEETFLVLLKCHRR